MLVTKLLPVWITVSCKLGEFDGTLRFQSPHVQTKIESHMSQPARQLVSLTISLILLTLGGNQLAAQDGPPANDMELVDRLIETKFSVHPDVWQRVPEAMARCLSGGGGGGLRFAPKENDDDGGDLVLSVTLYGSGVPIVGQAEYEVSILPHEEDGGWLLEFNGHRLLIDGGSMHVLTEAG